MATAFDEGGPWSRAVPLGDENGDLADAGGWDKQKPKFSSGKGVQRRSSAWDLMSDSETTKQRKTSMRQSNATAGRKSSKNQLRDTKRGQDDRVQERVDDSAWIHRDKLAQIEIQEMEEAGLYRRSPRRSESEGPARHRASRSLSRSGCARSRTDEERQHEIINDDDYAAAYPGPEDSPQKRVSTVPSAPEEDVKELPHHPSAPERESFDPYRDSQFRNGADLNGLSYTQRQQQQPTARPGTSRIPVSRASPVPVPSQVVDRDTPLPRSRAGSQNWAGSFDEMQYARKARSGSTSSQILLDHDNEAQKITPPGSSNKNSSNDENSPAVLRVAKKTEPGVRNASRASTTRPGSAQGKRGSSTSRTRRPGSSSDHRPRPTNMHPPEGDPPWISSMYQPDPRLPPDQQLLPTHAKRMMQEQWEKEGKTGSVYDRDFKPLNGKELPQPPPVDTDSQNLVAPLGTSSPSKDQPSPNESANGASWPLSPLGPAKSDNKSDAGSVRPGTSGGYRITPTISDAPNMHRTPLPSPGQAPEAMPAHNPTPRVPEVSEKDEAEPKRGCCCVMM